MDPIVKDYLATLLRDGAVKDLLLHIANEALAQGRGQEAYDAFGEARATCKSKGTPVHTPFFPAVP